MKKVFKEWWVLLENSSGVSQLAVMAGVAVGLVAVAGVGYVVLGQVGERGGEKAGPGVAQTQGGAQEGDRSKRGVVSGQPMLEMIDQAVDNKVMVECWVSDLDDAYPSSKAIMMGKSYAIETLPDKRNPDSQALAKIIRNKNTLYTWTIGEKTGVTENMTRPNPGYDEESLLSTTKIVAHAQKNMTKVACQQIEIDTSVFVPPASVVFEAYSQ